VVLTLIHSVKGESATLGLNIISDSCHEFESKIDDLRQKPVLAGDDFLSLTILLDRLISINEQIKSVFSVISGRSQNVSAQEISGIMTNQLIALASQISERQKKKVAINVAGFENPSLGAEQKKHVYSLASQLLRNAISHGIELPEQRKANGKGEDGQISMVLYNDSQGGLKLTCEDDGGGVDFTTLTEKAIEQGLLQSTAAEKTSPQSVLNLMLRKRLSSKAEADIDAGRGAGLSVVGATAAKIGAKLSLRTQAGTGTLFTLRIPQESDQNVAETTPLRGDYA